MKKLMFIFAVLFSLNSIGQELINFYLSPNTLTSEASITLHTTFYHTSSAGLIGDSYTINGNIINFSMCYILGPTPSPTLDYQTFEINVPSGFENYTLNIELISSYTNNNCTTLFESGSKSFSLPYNPTEKIAIPDDTFESYLEELKSGDGIDENNLVYRHKVENIITLYLYVGFIISLEDKLENLTGLNYFTALKKIWFPSNLITELDLSQNVELKQLRCGDNMISNLDLTNNIKLERVSCALNLYETLDLSNNIELNWLSCSSPNLIDLNISNNIFLEQLFFEGDNMTTIDLNNNVNLKGLGIGSSQISYLDLTNNVNLQTINISSSNLTDLNYANNTLLEKIELNGNQLLTSLNVTSLTKLEDLLCMGNQITELDLSTNSNLKRIFLLSNNLSSLNVKNGNNENIDLFIAIANPNLFCIDVDNPDEATSYGWAIDSQTEFSLDCSTESPIHGISNKSNNQSSNNPYLYPNPTKNTLNIETQGQLVESVIIRNLQGSIVKENLSPNNIDVSHLASGLYFVSITKEGHTFTKKFIKR